MGRPTKYVALGGGHGLYATLSALRRLPAADITAVVTVADDGGSSGRIRRELGVLPPGDLRMALAALCEPVGPAATGAPAAIGEPAATGRTPDWAPLLQHRLGGSGALAGHPVGNLLLTGLLERTSDPVAALDELATMVGARGRVLPMACRPLDLVGDVATVDPDDPVRRRRIRGQSAIAATSGRVESIELIPPDAQACPEAVEAIGSADVVVLGPGSWFTSVIPHLLLTELAEALIATPATVVVAVNLEQEVGETTGLGPTEHLAALLKQQPALRIDAVVADSAATAGFPELRGYCASIGATLLAEEIAAERGSARHDPTRFADALGRAATVTMTHRASSPSTTGPILEVTGENATNVGRGVR